MSKLSASSSAIWSCHFESYIAKLPIVIGRQKWVQGLSAGGGPKTVLGREKDNPNLCPIIQVRCSWAAPFRWTAWMVR